MAEMVHFIRQMQAFCHLEVIECSWKIFVDFLNKKEGDLDAMINAHRSYLDRMVRKILLLSSKAGREETLLGHVREAFTIILKYREATDNFYNHCLTESSRRDEERDTRRGVYTGPRSSDTQSTGAEVSVVLRELSERLTEYGTSFSERVQTIVHHLQGHSDHECRFLAVRLSFSEFYKSRREVTAKN